MKAARPLRLVRAILMGWLLACWAWSVSAQSLAEVAKKEKERREKNEEQATKVVTDRDLTSGYGGLRTLPARPAAQGQASTSETSATGQTEASSNEGEEGEAQEVDETETREYWQNRVAAVKEKIARYEEELQSEDWGEGQRFGVDPRGLNNLERRQQVEQNLAGARAELEALSEEARRSGVPAGWVR